MFVRYELVLKRGGGKENRRGVALTLNKGQTLEEERRPEISEARVCALLTPSQAEDLQATSPTGFVPLNRKKMRMPKQGVGYLQPQHASNADTPARAFALE